MKQISRLLSFAAAAAMCFSACSPEELKNGEVNVDKFVTVHFGTENTDPASTKATLTPTDEYETAFQAAWVNGDEISVKYSNDSESENATGTTTATWNGTSFESKMPEYTGIWTYDAAYPVPSESDSSVDFGPNRTQKGNAYNSKYDIMIGSAVAENAAAGKKDETGKDIVFMMTRQTAIAYFHFTSDLDEAVTSATLKVTDGAIANSSASINDKFKFVAPQENDLTEINLTFEEGTAPSAKDFQLWFNVLPTTYDVMTLTVETATKSFTISKDTKGNLDMYEAGKLYKVKKSGIAWTNKPVVLYCSDVTTTGSYNSNVSHIKNAKLPFEYKQIMANGKNSPSGYGAGQLMQFKGSTDAKGEIYNTSSFGSPIKRVEVYSQSENAFYVYYGDSEAPSDNKKYISRPTTPSGTKTISIEDNNGNKNVEKEVNYYLFDISTYNADYIRIVNGSKANYFYKIVLHFDEPETVQVTGIELDKTKVTINKGEKTTLTATITPADATIKDITWTSNNESVATVTDGVVSGLSAGTATITATTVDGSFTASCDVTVTAAPATVWSKTYTSNVVISGAKVIIGTETYDAIQVGTAKKSGSKTFKVPANTTKLSLHVVGWNGEDGKTHTIETNVGTISSSSIITKADSGAKNSTPFTLSSNDYSSSDYFYEFTLSGVTSEATITISNSAGSSRGVYFGINYEL